MLEKIIFQTCQTVQSMLSFFVVMSSSGNYILQDCSLFAGLRNKIGLIYVIERLHYGCKCSSFHFVGFFFGLPLHVFIGSVERFTKKCCDLTEVEECLVRSQIYTTSYKDAVAYAFSDRNVRQQK